jgi:ribonuclease P protein component
MKKSFTSLSFIDFKKIQGKRPLFVKRGRFFNCAYFPGEELKISCVVSKKKAKNAVTRNLIRRRFREAVRKLLEKTLVKKGFYVVSVNISGVEKVSFFELQKDIESLIS